LNIYFLNQKFTASLLNPQLLQYILVQDYENSKVIVTCLNIEELKILSLGNDPIDF